MILDKWIEELEGAEKTAAKDIVHFMALGLTSGTDIVAMCECGTVEDNASLRGLDARARAAIKSVHVLGLIQGFYMALYEARQAVNSGGAIHETV